MAEWKKVLVSGSDISVRAITASLIPDGDSGDKVLVITSDGGIKKVEQTVVQGNTVANFDISGSTGNNEFDATEDTLIFAGTNGATTTVDNSVAGDTKVTINLPDGTISGSAQVNIASTVGYTAFSSSFADDIATNVTNITANDGDITSLQNDVIALEATASELHVASASFASFINTANSDIDGIENSIAALDTFTSSVVTNANTSSFLISSSVIGTENQITVTANNPTPGESGIQIGLTNNVTIGGRLEAGKLVVQGEEIADVGAAQVNGSTIQGNDLTNIHRFTGSLQITGGLEIKGTDFTVSDLAQNDFAGLTSVVIRRYSDGKLFRAGAQLRSEISGAFKEYSASLAEDIANLDTTLTTTNATDITALQLISASLLTSQSEGIRFETSVNNGASSALGETASFAASGDGLSVDIVDGGSGVTTVTYTIDPDAVADSVGAFSGSEQLQDALDGIYVQISDMPISGAAQLQTLGFLTSSNFDDLDDVPSGIISGAAVGDAQGQIKFNDVNVNINGLQAGSDPTFNNLTVTNNLTVNGSTTSIKTDNLNIEDQFILINSGASDQPDQTGERDGGIIVDSGNGKGALLMYNYNRKSWGFKGATDPANGVIYNEESDSEGEVLPDVHIATVTNGSNGAVGPTTAPEYGTGNYQKGQMHINNDDSTIWIYV